LRKGISVAAGYNNSAPDDQWFVSRNMCSWLAIDISRTKLSVAVQSGFERNSKTSVGPITTVAVSGVTSYSSSCVYYLSG